MGFIRKLTAVNAERKAKLIFPKAIVPFPIFAALLKTALMGNHLLGNVVKELTIKHSMNMKPEEDYHFSVHKSLSFPSL